MPTLLSELQLEIEGWNERVPDDDSLRVWHDAAGDMITLSVHHEGFRVITDALGLQHMNRSLAESNNAGLVECSAMAEGARCAALIYKTKIGDAFKWA